MILLHGVPEEKSEETATVISTLISTKLQVSGFSKTSISRCHRLGRPSDKSSRPVVVKFSDIVMRDKVWFSKTKLKGTVSAVNIENVSTYPKTHQLPLNQGATTQSLKENFNPHLLPIQWQKNYSQGIYPQKQYLRTNHQLPYLPDQNIKELNYEPRNDGRVQNIHDQNFKPPNPIDSEPPVNEFKITLNSPRGYYLSQAGIEHRILDAPIQPSNQYFNQKGLRNNGFNTNNENVPKFQGVELKRNPDITSPLDDISTKINGISLEHQQRPIETNIENYYQVRNIPSAINTGNQNDRNIQPIQNHFYQTGSGFLTQNKKLNALEMPNNQQKESRPGYDTREKNLSAETSDHNKRYKVIHKNGAVEYYDDLDVILKKYPLIKIATNILYSQRTQNTNLNKVNNISPVIPMSNPKIAVLLPSPKLKDHADNFSQYTPQNNIQIPKNEQAYQKPPNAGEEKAILKTLANKVAEKPFVSQLSSLKLNQNIQVQPSMLENNEKNLVTTNVLDKGSENSYVSSLKTEHITALNVSNAAQVLPRRSENVVEQPVTHILSNNNHPEVSLRQSSPNILSESSKSRNTTVITSDSNLNSNITKPMTTSSVLNENKNKNISSIVQLNTKTNLERSPLFNFTSGLSKSQGEHDTNIYKENIFDQIRTINLTTPELFDENLSIDERNVTGSKSEFVEDTENTSSTDDSIKNSDDQDKGLSKSQGEHDTNIYKENIFDQIRTINLTTPELFDENLSIDERNVTGSKSEFVEDTENTSSTDDSIKNSDDQDKDYLSLSKPEVWLRTTDPDFWKNLIDDNDAYSFVYIFDVQSQSRIEKDTKTTIYPNGTVIEEITETTWENGDGDQPKIFKTVKVTLPDDEKKDKNNTSQ
ncbi:unnamed protein product [Parnassius mnemosyne]|uniref:Uncharacterized protein n=1 Tax=Parnassius mnemosyne TaxID=213953 RepID=A0AAV1M8H3_9NEOP